VLSPQAAQRFPSSEPGKSLSDCKDHEAMAACLRQQQDYVTKRIPKDRLGAISTLHGDTGR